MATCVATQKPPPDILLPILNPPIADEMASTCTRVCHECRRRGHMHAQNEYQYFPPPHYLTTTNFTLSYPTQAQMKITDPPPPPPSPQSLPTTNPWTPGPGVEMHASLQAAPSQAAVALHPFSSMSRLAPALQLAALQQAAPQQASIEPVLPIMQTQTPIPDNDYLLGQAIAALPEAPPVDWKQIALNLAGLLSQRMSTASLAHSPGSFQYTLSPQGQSFAAAADGEPSPYYVGVPLAANSGGIAYSSSSHHEPPSSLLTPAPPPPSVLSLTESFLCPWPDCDKSFGKASGLKLVFLTPGPSTCHFHLPPF